MQRACLIVCLIFGFVAREAQAYEYGLGMGRMYSCLSRLDDDGKICALGPAASVRWGLNLWGRGYRVADHAPRASSQSSSGSSFFNSSGGDWEELVLVVVVAMLVVSIGYALIYPFSSRMDLGFVGQTGLQRQDSQDLNIWRNEVGLYMRAYLSQHFPLYLYGSGSFSRHSIYVNDQSEGHNVFVKRAGFGLMDPEKAGLYFHGLWERSSILDPTARDLLEDSGTNRLRKKSVVGILDASYFELGYLWQH
jgi:hypothetical protein